MIVVSDTSALTSLMQVNRVDILRHLCGIVLIPPAVEDELRVIHPSIPEFIQTVPVRLQDDLRRLLTELHSGEAQAIAVAKERGADLILVDETAGRRVAKREGLQVIGLLGVIVQAKRAGVVHSVRQLTAQLEEIAGFRVAAEIKELVFTRAGE